MDPLLFAYGTLRRDSPHPMREVLAAGADWLGRAEMPGLLYDLGSYPGLVPDPERRHWVRGDLYRLRDPAALLPVLDEYEGCGAAETDAEYRRERSLVYLRRREPVAAWVYLYNRPVTGLAPLTAGGSPHQRLIEDQGAPLDR